MRRLCALGLLLVMLLAGCAAPGTAQDPGECTLTFITIGKGDSFLLTSPDGRHYLVDTGKAEDFRQIAHTLHCKGVEQLDGIFLSHGHKDHAGSLDLLLEAFPTGRVYYSGLDDQSYHDILPEEICAAHDVPAEALQGGETMDLGGVTAQVWIPDQVDPENENNNSLVLRLKHGKITMLLTGDAEEGEEERMVQTGFAQKADLLKLGHHGEDDASSTVFLDKVKPSIALIAGNQEENPESVNDTITQRLQERNIQAYYSEGDPMDFTSDGKLLRMQRLEEPEWPAGPQLVFDSVDRAGQRVVIRNAGQTPADLGGCLLYSVRGEEQFVFPRGTVLQAGASIAVVCQGMEEDGALVWPEEKVWRKKRDDALLYDRTMILLAEDAA